eukprot:m.44541 g.44541  ORF g.44541 m.44541 type:complete len:54 (+) comp19701_c0_seq2:401-562(+)
MLNRKDNSEYNFSLQCPNGAINHVNAEVCVLQLGENCTVQTVQQDMYDMDRLP